MQRHAIVLAGILSLPAHAQEAPEPPAEAVDRVSWTLSGAGGLDYPSNQVWAGAELAAHPTQRRGLAPQMKLTPAYSISDNTALIWAEAGGTVVVPSEQTPDVIIRVGVVGRVQVPFVRWPLPVRLGDEGTVGVGLVPTGQLLLELGWEDRPGVTGAITLRGGVGSEAFLGPCAGLDPAACQVWLAGFVGSVGGRLRWRSGLHIEATAGTTFRLAVGRHF